MKIKLFKFRFHDIKGTKIQAKNTKNKNFKYGIHNIIFPIFCIPKKSKFSRLMEASDNIIKKKMSYNYIFRHLIQYERLKKILLTQEQLILIDNLPKIKLNEMNHIHIDGNELRNNVQVVNSNLEDKINNRLMSIFK